MFGRKKKENELKGFNGFDYQEELDVYESIGYEKNKDRVGADKYCKDYLAWCKRMGAHINALSTNDKKCFSWIVNNHKKLQAYVKDIMTSVIFTVTTALIAVSISFVVSTSPLAQHSGDYLVTLQKTGEYLVANQTSPAVPLITFFTALFIYGVIMIYVIKQLNKLQLRMRFDEDILELIEEKQCNQASRITSKQHIV